MLAIEAGRSRAPEDERYGVSLSGPSVVVRRSFLKQ